jgi:hypothetical protein
MKNRKVKGGIREMNKVLLGVIAVSLLAVLGVSFVSAFGFGFGGKNLGNITDEQKAALEDKRDAVREAVENNDYEAWKEIMSAEITEEKFNEIVERHQKMEQFHDLMNQLREAYDSDDEEAIEDLKAQISELGFEQGMGKGKGMHAGMQGEGLGRGVKGNANCPMMN